jgi:hypothetical protein
MWGVGMVNLVPTINQACVERPLLWVLVSWQQTQQQMRQLDVFRLLVVLALYNRL